MHKKIGESLHNYILYTTTYFVLQEKSHPIKGLVIDIILKIYTCQRILRTHTPAS